MVLVKWSEKQMADEGGKRGKGQAAPGGDAGPKLRETARPGSWYTDTCPWSITLVKSCFSS